MTQHWFRLYAQRSDTTKNMARFYAMSIEPDLFGGSALVRRWGRIGTRGQERIDLFTDDLQAISPFLFLGPPEASPRPHAQTALLTSEGCLPLILSSFGPGGGSPYSAERWDDARRIRLAQSSRTPSAV